MACGEESGGCAASTMMERIGQEFGAGKFCRAVIGRLEGTGAGGRISLEFLGGAPQSRLRQTTAGILVRGLYPLSISWINYSSSMI